MTNPAIQMIETASQIFLAPPHMVSPQQRHEAETIILDFRKIKCPYQLCKELLETSSAEYVLFEAVGLLKSAVIKEWAELNDSDILSLRRYLLQYVLHRQLPSFVREKILQLMAIMVKRMSLDDHGNERRTLIDEAQRLLSEGPQSPSCLLGCSILQALLQEHAITVKSADIGLPWSQHFKLKKQFEATELRTIFAFVMKVLEELESSGAGTNPSGVGLMERLLLVAEAALCWGHMSPLLPKRLVGVFESVHESDSPAALRRSGAWRLLLTAERLPIVLGSLAAGQGPLRRPALSCLAQLGTLSGAALPEEAKGEHALRVARSLIPLLTTSPFTGPAAALRRLVLHFSRELLSLPQNDFHHLLHAMATYATQLVELAALEEAGGGSEEESGSREALEAALEAWVGLLHAASPPLAPRPSPLPPALIEGSAHIFMALLRARLAPPDGTRCAGVEDDVEVEEEGSDLERCDSLLQLVGALGRAAPAHTLPLLCRLLEARTLRMQELLQAREESKELCNVYEDLHWTLLFAGHVLTMEGDGDGDGETPLMPEELVHFSEQSPSDMQASLRLLADTSLMPNSADLQAADLIVRLVSGVWRMCFSCGWSHGTWAASPAVAASAAWLLRRWARSYLANAGAGTERGGIALAGAWGTGASRGWSARLATGARSLLLVMPGEPHVTARATALLVTVASNKHREADTEHCQQLWEAVAWGLGRGGAGLAGGARRGLARAAALASAPLAIPERRARFAAVLQHVRATVEGASTEPALVQAFDVYAGLSDGAQCSSAECIWEESRLALSAVSRLACNSAGRAGGALAAGLRCAAAMAGRLACVLAAEPAAQLLRALTLLLSAHAGLQPPPPGDTLAEDDFCEEMSLVMEVVHGVAGVVWMQDSSPEMRAAAVSGAHAVLPRLAPPSPLLQRPTLAHQYFRLLHDLGSRNICALEDEYFNAAMASIEAGLECGAGGSGAGPVCELLGELASLAAEESPRLALALGPLAGRLLCLAAEGGLQEVLRAASSALYSLLCSLPHLRAQVPPGLAAHPFDGQRQHCLRFRDDFEKFIADVQNSPIK